MEDNLANLTSLLNEFFGPTTSNQRKREIEIMLENFNRSKGSWKQSLYFLSSSQNQYVLMYCLSVIENSIKIRWTMMNSEEQNELKSTVSAFLGSENLRRHPHFVRNKIVKLLCDLGKFSWPHSYPDFFSNIYQIASNNETVVIGLLFLKTISEEWQAFRDEISCSRKIELKNEFEKELPRIYQFLYNILETAYDHRRKLPPIPPSPTSSSSSSTDSNNGGGINSHSHLNEIIVLSLDTIALFTSWAPLNDVNVTTTGSDFPAGQKHSPYPIELVQLLCKITLMDLYPTNALSALNEILYRKYIPKEFEDHMNFIVKFAIQLLNEILQSSNTKSLTSEKVVEFLSLIANNFYRYDEVSGKALLSLLLPYTFKQTETRLYYQSLEVWARILSYLTAQLSIQIMHNTADEILEGYKSPILALANGIIQSNVKFQSIVEESFDVEDDDDVETFTLLKNAEILVKIGDLMPTETLKILQNTWENTCRFYSELLSHMDESKTVLNYENTIEIEHFSFIVQFAGRVASIFYGNVFKQELDLGKNLFQQLVNVAIFSKNFYFIKSPQIIVEANCQIIYSLTSWVYWLSRYHSEIVLSDSTMENQQVFFETLGSLSEFVFFALENRSSIDTSIVKASTQFFTVMISSIRTQYLFQVSSLKTLVEKIHPLRNSMDTESFRLLNKSVAGLLFLPWQNTSIQEWEHRTDLYRIYMTPVIQGLVNSTGNPNTLVFHLQLLNDQLELLKSESGISKKICWEVFKEIIPFLHTLLSTYLRRSGVSEEILNLFLKILEVLGQCAGSSYFEDSIRRFIDIFSTENIIQDLLNETETSCIVVEKFLNMLQFMVKDPSPSFKKFLHETLDFSYGQLYPILSVRSTPDLKIPFFHLVRDVLLFRWSYFFPTSLSQHQRRIQLDQQQHNIDSRHQQQQNNSQMIEDPIVEKRFEQILESLGHSFLQQDIQIFRFNLNTLLVVNEKHKLFSKFSSQILSQFLTVLIQVLIQKSHDLLREEITSCLWELNSNLRFSFKDEFLPAFLASHFPVLSTEQKENLVQKFNFSSSQNQQNRMEKSSESIDLPSFGQALNTFIDELRYFHFLSECQKQSEPTAQGSEH